MLDYTYYRYYLSLYILVKIYFSYIVNMIDSFDMNGHICLVFPILGESTYDFQKANDFLPYQFNDIKNMAYQMLKAIECMYFTIFYGP